MMPVLTSELEYVLISASNVLFFCAIAFGEFKFIKYGRPAYYQFILCGLFAGMVAIFYNCLMYTLFNEMWDGMILVALTEVGSSLFLMGAVWEFFLLMKKKDQSFSVLTGTEVTTVLLPLLPPAVMAFLFFLICKKDNLPINVITVGITVIVSMIFEFFASLIIFRKSEDARQMAFPRKICAGIVLFKILALVLYYAMFFEGSVYVVFIILYEITGIIVIFLLEKGFKAWT